MRKLKKTLFTIISLSIFFFAFILPEIGSWYQQGFTSIGDKIINDITFIDSLNGFAIASRNVNPDTSIILKTTNGGDNWGIVFNQGPKRFSKISFINLNTGFVSGGSGGGTPNLYKTTNAGINWILLSSFGCAQWEGMHVLNEDTLWLVEHDGLCGGVYRTTNGGTNWTQQLNVGNQNATKIYMFNARIGFISNGLDNNFKKTTNGGTNWFDVPGGAFTDIKFVDSLTGWKAFGNIKKTTDGGLNWVTQNIPQAPEIIVNSFEKLTLLNKDTIWSVGGYVRRNNKPYGMIYKTTNGGINWGYQITDTSIHINLFAFIQFTDKLKGWAYSSFPSSGGVHTKTGGLDTTIFTSINLPGNETVLSFRLYQNYPNPFNPATTINYVLRIANYVSLKIYDLNGKEIQLLVNQRQNAGSYEVKFNGSNLSSGIYFYTLTTNSFSDTKKMLLIK